MLKAVSSEALPKDRRSFRLWAALGVVVLVLLAAAGGALALRQRSFQAELQQAREALIEVDSAALALHRCQRRKLSIAGDPDLRNDADGRQCIRTLANLKPGAGRKSSQRDAADNYSVAVTLSGSGIDSSSQVRQGALPVNRCISHLA